MLRTLFAIEYFLLIIYSVHKYPTTTPTTTIVVTTNRRTKTCPAGYFMPRSTSRSGNGQMIHLVVALAALTMDGFPFAHLGDLSDLPAQTPSPQDWAAVGMSPPR